MLCAGVLVEPETGEMRQVPEVPDLREIGYLVLTHVQLAETTAAGELAQGTDLVYTEIRDKLG